MADIPFSYAVTPIMKAEGTVAAPGEHMPKLVLTQFLIKFILVICLASLQGGFNYWIANDPVTLKQYMYNISVEITKKGNWGAVIPLPLLICIICSFPLGFMVGIISLGPLADKCGRKRILQLTDLISIGTDFTTALSQYFKAFAVYALARLVAGFYTGLSAGGVPMLLAEIAPTHKRGSIVILPLLVVTVGMIVSQLLGAPEILGTKTGMPILLSIPGIIALFQLVLLHPYPESPRYLLIQKRDEEGARNALQKLRGEDDVDDEIEELHQEDAYEENEKQMTIRKLLSLPTMRWPLLCLVALYTTQQLSGINAAYYYAEKVFVEIEVDCSNLRYCSVMVTAASLFGQALSIYKIDSWGRRPLVLSGFGICIITSVLLTMTLELQAVIPDVANVSVFLLMIFVTGIVLGPNSIPILMTAELFLQSSRASAFAVLGFYQWLLVTLVSTVFLSIEAHIKSYSFLVFVPFCLAGFIYTFKIVPETKGKTFLDIRKLMEAFLSRKFLDEKPDVKKKRRKR